MADIDFGTGPDTNSGDTVAQALLKLQNRVAALAPALTIAGSPGSPIVGSSATFTPTVSGGIAPYVLSLLSGTLPGGRALANGSITGTYTTAGTFSYTLRATDSSNPAKTADLPISLTVASATAPLAISGTPAAAVVGQGAVFTPNITGGTAPYTLSLLSGTLPAGRSLSGLTVAGTYTTAASYSYTLRATDAVGATADLPLTVTVTSTVVPITISGTPGGATVGSAYTFTPTTANGSGTKAFALTGTLPAGLTFSTTTGAIAGTPTTAATTTGLNITVSDTSGSASLGTFSLVVASATTTLNALTVSNGSGTVGTALSSTINGLTSGSSVSLTGAGAAGLSITGAIINGTPTTAGAVNIVETLAGATNSPRTTSGVITVAAAGVQPLMFNADNIRMGTGSGNATATNTSWQGHTIHYVANECTELRFIFVNWYVNNSSGEVINNPDVPLNKASACNGTTAAPIMFNGSRSTTLTGSVAFTMSDPIYPAAFGLTTFPAGFALDVRCKGTLVATTGRLALAAFVAKYSNAAGVGYAQIYAPANDVDYVDTPGGMPAITGASVTFGTPLAAIVGRNVVAGKLAVIGDGHSAMYGVGDTQTADAWVSGHFGRAQHDANGAGPIIPMFNGGLSSATLKAWVSGHAYRSQFDQFANVAYMEFLSNDMSSRTIAQMTADMQTYISSKRANGIKRVFTSDVLTRTLATSYSVTSLTVSGTTATATVANTANMTNGQQLDVSGASISGFNGTKTITVNPDGTTFSYQVASGLATPTGTIVAVDNWATAAGQGEVALYENNASSVRNTLNNTTLPSLTGPTMFDEVMTLRNIVQMGGVDHQFWNYNGTSKFQTADGIHSSSSVVGTTPVTGHAAMGAYDRQRLLAYQAAGL